MHALLDPPGPERSEALEAVHRWLRGSIRRWRVARLLLGRDSADALGVLLAWHLVSRELLTPGLGELSLHRTRDELLATLHDAQERQARSVLGVALAWAMPRFEISPLAIRSRIEALERDAHIHAFASRAEIRAHLARTAHPEARVYLILFGLSGEREELLAQALASALERIRDLRHARSDLEQRGRMVFSAEELGEAKIKPADLYGPGPKRELDRLFERAIEETRAELLKGWALCECLGPWRGRQLAFVLHWFAADLSGLEFAREHGKEHTPRGGFLRLVACTLTALASRRPGFT